MDKLTRQDLYSLEKYEELRNEFRHQVMMHKKNRRLPIGDHVTLYFEDRLTMQYQIQEMLRIERIFKPAEIEGELDAYNPLIPDGCNLKATMMIEYQDEMERRQALKRLIGIEKKLWLQVGELTKVVPIVDEDLERETEEKTSSIHFLRFELTPEMKEALIQKTSLVFGIDHPQYSATVIASEALYTSLLEDLK